MNVNEVPQDEKDFKDGSKVHKLLYAVGKDGKYTGVTSAGWEPENVALKQAWDEVEDSLKETLAKVKAGELSPIAFYMEKNLMDIALLSKYMGKWKWQVKKHFTPSVFKALDEATLNKYAQVFNITVAELKNFGKDTR